MKHTNSYLQPYHLKIFLFLVLIVFFLFMAQKVKRYAERNKEQPSKPMEVTIVIKDTIPKYDSTVLSRLEIRLKKREGFSPVRYKEGNHQLCGYGHYMLDSDKIPKIISMGFADSLLRDDIRKSYVEVIRLRKAYLYDEVFEIFISGKTKINVK